MKNIALALIIGAMAFTVNPVMAADDDFVADQKQECRQVVEQECEAGAYGQTTSCKQKAEQVCKQKQKVVVRAAGSVAGKTTDKIHSPAETALDLQTSIIAAGIISTGVAAYALKRKVG